jgi:hypothetical protein
MMPVVYAVVVRLSIAKVDGVDMVDRVDDVAALRPYAERRFAGVR